MSEAMAKARRRATDEQDRLSPKTLTPDEAIARLHVWTDDPPEELTARLCKAAVAWSNDFCSSNVDELRAASAAWTAARPELVHTVRGSFGAPWAADDVRALLRRATRIVEVRGQTEAGIMLRARGCHIACQDIDGRWIGVGSRGEDDA